MMKPQPARRRTEAGDGSDVEAALERLAAERRRLWPGGELAVPVLGLSDRLAGAIFDARRARRLVRGLEAAERALENEAAGLAATGAASPRVTRLLLVSDDASERFYRRVERLALRHRRRLRVLRLRVDAPGLGARVYGGGEAVRALLVDRRDAAERVLRALLDGDGEPA